MQLRRDNEEQWNKLNELLTKKYGKSYRFVSGDELRKVFAENPDIIKTICGEDDIKKSVELLEEEPVVNVVEKKQIRKNVHQFTIKKGGPGSGCHGENCGRPSTGVATSQRPAGVTGERNDSVINSAKEYAKKIGVEYKETEPVVVNPDKAREVAQAYEELQHNPNDPKVREAYGALVSEIDDQYKNLPVKIEFVDTDPYKSSKEMMSDVRENGRLKVYRGGEPHELLAAKDENGLTHNEKFRAIHDYYGHAAYGYGFNAHGEENAYVEHNKLFSPTAQPALLTETKGQNSWYNFSRTNDGKPNSERKFAEQKAGLLPEKFWPESARTNKVTKGGPGSGCRGENCGRPSTGLKDEPYQSKIRNVVEQTRKPGGGSTTNLKTGKSPTEGYSVSPYKDREWKVPEDKFGIHTVDAYIEQNADLLSLENHHLGTWNNKDDKNVYLDVSIIESSLEDAKRVARENNQLAIYGLKEGHDIKIEDETNG